MLEELSKRDLTVRVKGSYAGDHTRLKDALNATAQALEKSLAQVSGAANGLSAASGEIASSSQVIARGASDQAKAIDEV